MKMMTMCELATTIISVFVLNQVIRPSCQGKIQVTPPISRLTLDLVLSMDTNTR